MRRMYSNQELITKPVLVHEQELLNESSVNLHLDKGFYLIELHTAKSSNMAIISVCEENLSVSTATMFNATEVGANLGYFTYDTLGDLLEFYDGTEGNITVKGHIDIYKF